MALFHHHHHEHHNEHNSGTDNINQSHVDNNENSNNDNHITDNSKNAHASPININRPSNSTRRASNSITLTSPRSQDEFRSPKAVMFDNFAGNSGTLNTNTYPRSFNVEAAQVQGPHSGHRQTTVLVTHEQQQPLYASPMSPEGNAKHHHRSVAFHPHPRASGIGGYVDVPHESMIGGNSRYYPERDSGFGKICFNEVAESE